MVTHTVPMSDVDAEQAPSLRNSSVSRKSLVGRVNADFMTQKKVSGSCFFHDPLTWSAEIGPARPLRLRGGRIIWVSLRWDALLRPLAQVRTSAGLLASAPLDVVAERPGVVGVQLWAHFLCAQEQADVLALQPEPASRLQA